MPETLSRHELYDLAWSGPMRNLAKRFGISDVALAKTCKQMHVPTPPQGYWNKKAAGKPAFRQKLPPRPVGLKDSVVLGGGRYDGYGHYGLTQLEILGPLPAEPTFTESLDEVQKCLEATVPKVIVSRDLHAPHPAVAKLLKKDEERRERQSRQTYISPWDAPLYDTPIQKRRLRLLSSIFLALAKEGCRVDTSGGHPYNAPLEDFGVTVGNQTVRLRASVVESKSPARGKTPASVAPARLRLALDPGEEKQPDGQSWEDGDYILEQQARSIVLAIMFKGEQQHRDSAVRSHTWRVELKASTMKRLVTERLEAERKDQERLATLERQRVERLLDDADAFRRARDIRSYVEDARATNARAPEPVSAEYIESWANWALAQADRIDPIKTGAFLDRGK